MIKIGDRFAVKPGANLFGVSPGDVCVVTEVDVENDTYTVWFVKDSPEDTSQLTEQILLDFYVPIPRPVIIL